ncbi:hypothetical protein [Fimbriimonas ginsengisoli]|uniref:Uncharacterized protein n=1 Tax=Fimbriimonas ginsengisoli Gsoil 348 TaxID=661478 RepID=A0A068NRA8_FIMGI|nr:hypothetical protein [Fimbriimonas ginsengisoli]AIE85310.1 hypothetical protein OP10G_1942 [Fimbriimonas ginsengisoli Gsoil 348]
MTLEISKDLAIIGGTILALTTFLTGAFEFARQSHLRRVEHFIQMRRRFLETPVFQQILRMITTDDPALCEVPVQDRRNFGGFLEEVALMVNSRLISREVAHYMFGHYVLLTDRSHHFWSGLDREGTYWKLLHRFATEMEEESKKPLDLKKLRF